MKDDSQKQRVIDTIAKLSKLTEDSGAFEGEISAASAKIQQLMDKYSISWDEIKGKQIDQQQKEMDKEFGAKPADYSFGTFKKWHWDLARLIARITHTRQFSLYDRMCFFGVKENCEVAASLYALWVGNFRSMSKAEGIKNIGRLMKKYGNRPNFRSWVAANHPKEDPKYFTYSWIEGCLHAMWSKIIEQELAREAQTSNAIVLYKEKVEEVFKATFTHVNYVNPKDVKGFSPAGYMAGVAVGRQINIGSKELGGKNG